MLIMKFLLISLGTRGDMEPFLAQAVLLKKEGHTVACCFPEQFRHLADEENLIFYTLGSDFIALINSDAGRAIMGGAKVSSWKRLMYLKELYNQSHAINRNVFAIQEVVFKHFMPDHVVFHPKSTYAFCRKDIPRTILSPVPYLIHPTAERAPIGININMGGAMNKLLYRLTIYAMQKNIIKTAGRRMKEYRLTKSDIRSAIIDTDIIYTVSKHLFPKPKEYPAHAKVIGYVERDKKSHWEPEAKLLDFMNKHNKLVMLTFGSMHNGNAQATTQLFIDVLTSLNIPTIINTSEGGLEQIQLFDKELFHFTNDIPYDWMFPKLHGVIHHGGSGTTHMAVKYACVSLIIPHIVDQFMWNDILSKMGLGPKGMSIRKLESNKLESLVRDFYNNEQYKVRAEEMSRLMFEDSKSAGGSYQFGTS